MGRVPASKHFVVLWSILVAVSTGMMGASAQESERPISGLGVIDRVMASGPEPVFRADGYTFRVNSATEVKFGAGLKALSEVGTNTLVKFQGKRDGSGEIIAAKVEFDRLKLPKHKTELTELQVTTFPPGSKIDAYKGFDTAATNLREEDEGGWCGWYPVPQDVALQERIRRVGMRLVPQYQRDLPGDDRAKIPFRFYAVEEPRMRTVIFCDRGLVLVPAAAVERLTNDDLLAAVLAEGVAGELQQQVEDGRPYTIKDAAKLAVSAAGVGRAAVPAGLGIGIDSQLDEHRKEQGRGRIALALMGDAGYDPYQAPEAWRLLAPGRLPKDLARLKAPERSQYLSNFLKVQ